MRILNPGGFDEYRTFIQILLPPAVLWVLSLTLGTPIGSNLIGAVPIVLMQVVDRIAPDPMGWRGTIAILIYIVASISFIGWWPFIAMQVCNFNHGGSWRRFTWSMATYYLCCAIVILSMPHGRSGLQQADARLVFWIMLYVAWNVRLWRDAVTKRQLISHSNPKHTISHSLPRY